MGLTAQDGGRCACRQLLKNAPQNRHHFTGQSTLKALGAILDKPLRRKKLNKLKGLESRVARRVEELKAMPH